MSVLLEMDMPKDCGHCILCEYDCGVHRCVQIQQSVGDEIYSGIRHKDCPLKEVKNLKQMTKEDRLKMIMEQEEFAFIKDIPQEQLWKLNFAISFINDESEKKSERAKGVWKWKESHGIDRCKCSKCGIGSWEMEFNYCPHCGSENRR